MSGFGGVSKRKIARDYAETPELVAMFLQRFPHRSKITHTPQAIADVKYTDRSQIDDEIARFKQRVPRDAFAAVFMTAPSPGIVATTMVNAHYASHEAYLMALARELRVEYRAIHDAGLILQVDAPDLAMERTMTFQDLPEGEFLKVAELHVAAINVALEGIPRDRVRLHCCFGNWEGPHIHDVSLGAILPLLYRANVGALSLEFANPRHQHEYAALAVNPLPAAMTLLAGAIDTTTNFVEHPQVVANRLIEAAKAVGRERVIASTDCGFGTFTGREWVVAPVVWQKLRALREGADIASRLLWSTR
jgi:5-methyltetrahydropteroyltriglutamate--homocysteine methyltransferase